ncbi:MULTISPECIES: lytic transglycosylase domain-containing protein [Halomonas]|uniref:Transglycosylase SLT domain-containing protein n=1 Tax=Halomonas halophila TaxID=29573 RepID=A0ABQ0U3B4_9GAMM|nr:MULTISPECIES: lytic transglycosylase domain-containing protein [Halomonas]MDR5890286.1 lytic transglycosylase domain-containing protein [Halomonas salina]WJY05796.1 lytic transglycosylase domain-containing protein [Halomonas halophila]GEK72942.1 hypothetical protein HHA04nite_14860 [Halomonas halophila]
MAERIDELLVGLGLDVQEESFNRGVGAFNSVRQAAISMGAVIGGSAVLGGVTKFAQELDKLGRTADRLNVGVSGMQQLGFTYESIGGNAQQAVSDIEALQGAIDDMAANPSGDSFAMLSAMGVDVNEVLEQRDAIGSLVNMLGQLEDASPQQRRIALESLGLSDTTVSLAREGDEFVQRQMAFAAKNAELTEEMTGQAREFVRELAELNETAGDLYRVIAQDMMGTLKPMLELLTRWAGEDGNFDLVSDLATGGPLKAVEGPVDQWLRENGLGFLARDIGEFVPGLSGNDEPQASADGEAQPDVPLMGGFDINNLRNNTALREMIAQAERDIGAPAGLLRAQIAQESSFNRYAVSEAGARGLAQIMPETEASLEDRFGRDLDPFDPRDAIMMQEEVMRENYQRFGNWDDAMRAYNAGWDREAWTNPETEAYVPSIRSRMNQPQASNTTNHNTFNISGNDPQAIAAAVDSRLRQHSERAAEDFRNGLV